MFRNRDIYNFFIIHHRGFDDFRGRPFEANIDRDNGIIHVRQLADPHAHKTKSAKDNEP